MSGDSAQPSKPLRPAISTNELNELVLKCAGEGIYCLDHEGRTTYLNPAGEAILGWRAEDFVGTFSHELIHHTHEDGSAYHSTDCPIYQAFHDGKVHHVVTEVFWRKDGTSFPVEYTSTPIVGQAGELLGAVVTFRDISERRAAELEIARLNGELELILASAGEGIYGLDAQGRTTFCNPATTSLLGWTTEEMIGKLQHDLIHHQRPDGAPYPRAECPIYATLTDGVSRRVDDEVFWHKDGTPVPVEYISTPVRDKSGKTVGAVVTFNDISERKEREAALRNALAEVKQLKARLEEENLYLREEVETDRQFADIIGSSEPIRGVLASIKQVAATDATVLLTGETGTGKELIARAIHRLSARGQQTMVTVNCAALPAGLLESELFGHEKGAFTGALARKIGRFELADKSTLFLDEIGDLPMELQAKLLRALQENTFERVGGTSTISVDVRVIAATNRDLLKAIDDQTFREDLYYRLNVFPIRLPALRERKEDLAPLVRHFVMRYARAMGKKIDSIPKKTINSMKAYTWPGNVRELQNVLQRAVILCPGSRLEVGDWLPKPAAGTALSGVPTLDDLQRRHIIEVLEMTNWRVSGDQGAAQILGMKATTLDARMKKLGIARPK